MTTLEELKNYRDHSNISQSELKVILSNKSYKKPKGLALIYGSYLDCLLTTPYLIQEIYEVKDISRVTPKIQELCESLESWLGNCFEVELSVNLEDHLPDISNWIETTDYYQNRPKTRVSTFVDNAKEWWKSKIEIGDKKLITEEEKMKFELIAFRLGADSSLNKYFLSKEVKFQHDFYWTEEEIGCKGLGDILYDEYVDLKYTTCQCIEDWFKICFSLNYPFQMAFYKSGLKANGYDVDCKWLVVGDNWHQMIPVTKELLDIGKWGYKENKNIQMRFNEINIIKRIPGYMNALSIVKNGRKEYDGTEKQTNDLFFNQI